MRMTDLELAARLNRTVLNAPTGEGTIAYVLFGIKYADELRDRIPMVVRIGRSQWPSTGMYEGAHNEINHGMRVTGCVELTNPPEWL